MTLENYLEKTVEVELTCSKRTVCKGKVVQIYGDNHVYVLPDGTKNQENAMGFSVNSVLFDIKIV